MEHRGDMLFAFDNSYARLPEHFYTRMSATPVPNPSWIALNEPLARELGADPESLKGNLEVFAGNATPNGASPLAQLYAGHQFGGWSPQLGDGRALLLGEVVDQAGARREGRGPHALGVREADRRDA